MVPEALPPAVGLEDQQDKEGGGRHKEQCGLNSSTEA